MKEKREKVERGINFTNLSKDHLVKNQKLLHEEMNMLTENLRTEKDQQTQERATIQVSPEPILLF